MSSLGTIFAASLPIRMERNLVRQMRRSWPSGAGKGSKLWSSSEGLNLFTPRLAVGLCFAVYFSVPLETSPLLVSAPI